MSHWEWDFFISHAGEDKAAIARPLARRLITAGYRVWFDEFEMRVGDSLRARIDEGLSKSRFGVVILSRAFFAKKWPRAELDGLFASDTYDHPRLLPVWHGIAADQVAAESPLMAARVAAVAGDVSVVAAELVRSASRSGLSVPGEALGALVAAGDADTLKGFLALNPQIVGRAVHAGRYLCVRPTLPECPENSPDFMAMHAQPSIDAVDLHAIILGPVQADDTDQVAAAFARGESFAHAAEVKGYGRGVRIRSESPEPGERGFVSALAEVTVVVGRRPDSVRLQSKWLSNTMRGVELRTYDWLIDAAADSKEYVDHLEVLCPAVPSSLWELTSQVWW